MSTSSLPPAPPLPIPITLLSSPGGGTQYLIFCPSSACYLRHTHHILGVLTGTLPQIPQQNVFLGLPLQLQPEEVCLLVSKGVGYIIDDEARHNELYASMSTAEKTSYQEGLQKEGLSLALSNAAEKSKKAERALQKAGRGGHEDHPTSSSPSSSSSFRLEPYILTPTTTRITLPPPHKTRTIQPPTTPSYPLFAYLHSLQYYLSPGLRFGCHFLVYPGDPLRYHSHFLASALRWEEEVPALDIVGGGRLGTGVKKGWMIGGKKEEDGKEEEGEEGNVRVFCVEWAGM